jgi:Cu(I)/Ag(I) efflux system membrane protein CusA/SilA
MAYEYALVDDTGAATPSYGAQDWSLRTWLQSVPGVAEVASFGGFQKQYQVEVDPVKLAARGIPIGEVVSAVRRGNEDVGGRLVELAGAEYMVRGRGYARSAEDIAAIAVRADERGTPVRVGDLGRVTIGPDLRRGVGDLDGLGDVVGGIVVMRHGENAPGHRPRPSASRRAAPSSRGRASLNLTARTDPRVDRHVAGELVAALVGQLTILIFLLHVPSAIVPIITILIRPRLHPMAFFGVSNIMSIRGITIWIESSPTGRRGGRERLQAPERWIAEGRQGTSTPSGSGAAGGRALRVLLAARRRGGVPPDLRARGRPALRRSRHENTDDRDRGRSRVTLDPAGCRRRSGGPRPRPLAWLVNTLAVGRYVPEERHPVSRFLFRIYEGPCRFVVRHRAATIAVAAALVLSTVPVVKGLGSEFMPPLWEGDLLYMPITFPGISVTQARELLGSMDRELAKVPEVARVHGKAGRADTSTDPAPLSMIETVIQLRPESEWRRKDRFYSGLPEWAQGPFRTLWPDRISKEELLADVESRMRFPGTTYSVIPPIKARIDMLSTGVRTPIGIKVLGSDVRQIEEIAVEIEALLKDVPGTGTAFAERTAGGYFRDFELDRARLARYGLSIADAQETILDAIGGEGVTTTIEGRARYSVNVRYARELRDDLDDLARVLVTTPSGASIPLSEVADLRLSEGPGMIRNENGPRRLRLRDHDGLGPRRLRRAREGRRRIPLRSSRLVSACGAVSTRACSASTRR